MSGNTLLQIFLYLQIFVMGALAAIAGKNAYNHFKSPQNDPEAPQHQSAHANLNIELSPDVKQRILQASEAQFKTVLNQSASKLQSDLGYSADQINNMVNRLAAEIISGELERYGAELNKLRSQANVAMGGISTEVVKHQEAVKAKITQELEEEKQKLIKQIDIKLGDAMGTFLVDVLGHNVDLGSQTQYLVSLLEERKADFIKEVGNETGTAK